MIIPRNCCQNFSSGYFDPCNLTVDMVDIVDIAHALSNICRFSGRTKEFYSVAQHCVIGANHILSQSDQPMLDVHVCETALSFLLHDASEAYLLDLPRPLKELPEFENYNILEKKIQRIIEQKFRLKYSFESTVIKTVDINLLFNEKRDLMEYALWTTQGQPLDIPCIVSLSPKEAKRKYLELFEDLWKRLRRS